MKLVPPDAIASKRYLETACGAPAPATKRTNTAPLFGFLLLHRCSFILFFFLGKFSFSLTLSLLRLSTISYFPSLHPVALPRTSFGNLGASASGVSTVARNIFRFYFLLFRLFLIFESLDTGTSRQNRTRRAVAVPAVSQWSHFALLIDRGANWFQCFNKIWRRSSANRPYIMQCLRQSS